MSPHSSFDEPTLFWTITLLNLDIGTGFNSNGSNILWRAYLILNKWSLYRARIITYEHYWHQKISVIYVKAGNRIMGAVLERLL